MHDLHTVWLFLQPESLARMETALEQECGLISPLCLNTYRVIPQTIISREEQCRCT